jgi:sugar lactone lactonase YvrE
LTLRRAFAPAQFAAPLVAVASLLLSGCGGSVTPGISPYGTGSAGTPGTAPGVHRVHVTVKIAVQANVVTRRPHFISPATASMNLKVVSGTKVVYDKTIDLTPASRSCDALRGTCTLDLKLQAGKYAASISAYDRAGGKGKALSTAQAVPFTVSGTGPTSVPLTLSGIPTRLVVTSAGPGTNADDLIVFDADGNIIVGPGAPKLRAVKTGGIVVVTVAQPAFNAPNLVAFAQPAKSVLGTETIGIKLSYPAPLTNACSAPGAVCTFTNVITAVVSAPLFAANRSNNTVLGFTTPLRSASQAAVYSLPSNGAYPLIFDANGNLFVGNSNGNSFSAFAPPYTARTFTNSKSVADPYYFAFDSHRNLFVANNSSVTMPEGSVTEYAAPYTGTPEKTITTAMNQPNQLALDASDNLYVANTNNSGSLERYAPPYTGTPLAIPTHTAPHALLVSGNTLIVGEKSSVEIFNLPLTSSGSPVPFATFTNAVGTVNAMTTDAQGNLWITNDAQATWGTVAEYKTPFSDAEAPTVTLSFSGAPGTSCEPYGILVDAKGNVYVANISCGASLQTQGGIVMFSPPLTNASVPKVEIADSRISEPYYLAMPSKPMFTVSP